MENGQNVGPLKSKTDKKSEALLRLNKVCGCDEGCCAVSHLTLIQSSVSSPGASEGEQVRQTPQEVTLAAERGSIWARSECESQTGEQKTELHLSLCGGTI